MPRIRQILAVFAATSYVLLAAGGAVAGDGDAMAAPGGDGLGRVLDGPRQAVRGRPAPGAAPRDVDGGPGLTQHQGDRTARAAPGPGGRR